MAQRDRHVGQHPAENFANPELMAGIGHRPQQPDGDRFHFLPSKMLGRRMHIIDAQRHDFPAADVDASANGARQFSRNVGFGIIEAPFEGALAGTFAKREYVGMTVH